MTTVRPPPSAWVGNGLSDSTSTPFGRTDLEADVPGDDLERLADLARDVVADAGRVRDVVEVAAAGVGHRLEQDLVEVLADTERRGAHAAGAQLGGVAGELVAVGDPLVGESIGQEQRPVDALLRERERDLLAAAQPAGAKVRAPAGVDLAEPGERGRGERHGVARVDGKTTSMTSS